MNDYILSCCSTADLTKEHFLSREQSRVGVEIFEAKRRKYYPTLTAGLCRYNFALSCGQPCPQGLAAFVRQLHHSKIVL